MPKRENLPEPKEDLKFIDVHCHLPFPRPKKNDNLPSNGQQLKDYFDQGGLYLITSTIDLNTLKITLKFIEKYPKNYGFTCGWAPQTVTYTPEKKYKREWNKWKNFVETNQDKFLAIGEIGLDFHHAKSLEKRLNQINELKKIFEITKNFDKPYVLHIRNAAPHEMDKEHPKHRFNKDDGATREALNIIDEHNIDPKIVMFHCFSGPEKYGRILPQKGFMLSVPSSAYGFERWREVTKHTPLKYLVTETDSYYQHPFKRGPVNVPSNVRYSIAAIAFSHGIDQKLVSKKTIENSIKFFDLKIK